MNGPLRLDQTLVPNDQRSIEIDVWPQRNGVRLDHGERDKLVGGAAGQEETRPEAGQAEKREVEPWRPTR
jgi:Zn-finger nucleic acid-binding protein